MFAAAAGLPAAVLGQVLIGIGCAPVFMGTLVVVARFFEPRRFAVLSSVLLAVGSVGTLTATTPLALTTELVGWRGAFTGMGGAVVLVSALVLLIVRDRPPGTMAAGERRPWPPSGTACAACSPIGGSGPFCRCALRAMRS